MPTDAIVSARAYGATVSDSTRDDDAEAPNDVVQAVADFVDDLVDDGVDRRVDGPEPTVAD